MIFGLSLLYWGLWLAILILWMGRFVTSFLSIYLVSALRLDEGVVGTVVAMYGFGAIIGCLFGGTLSDRFGRQSMIIIGEIGAAAALLFRRGSVRLWCVRLAAQPGHRRVYRGCGACRTSATCIRTAIVGD